MPKAAHTTTIRKWSKLQLRRLQLDGHGERRAKVVIANEERWVSGAVRRSFGFDIFYGLCLFCVILSLDAQMIMSSICLTTQTVWTLRRPFNSIPCNGVRSSILVQRDSFRDGMFINPWDSQFTVDAIPVWSMRFYYEPQKYCAWRIAIIHSLLHNSIALTFTRNSFHQQWSCLSTIQAMLMQPLDCPPLHAFHHHLQY